MSLTLFRLYVKEYLTRKRKIFLITFAIAWGTISLLLLMSFGRGLHNQIQIGMSGLGQNLLILYGGQTTKVFQGLDRNRRIRIYPEDADLIKSSIPGVINVCREYYTSMDISYKNIVTNRTVNGVDETFKDIRSTYALQGGRFINKPDVINSRRVVFVGWKLAAYLFKDEEPVGKTIFVDRKPFQVIGVMKKKLQMGNYQGMAYNQIYIPSTTFANIYSQKFVDMIHVQISDRSLCNYVEKEIYRLLGKKYRFDPDDEYALNVWNTVRNARKTANITKGIEIFLAIMGFLTIFIGAVGVTNLLYAIVKERTKEIGIKMALGAKTRDIIFQFMGEAFMIFARGTFWGTLVAFNIVALVRSVPVSYEMTSSLNAYLLRPVFSLDILGVFIVIMGGVVFLAGIFPAVKASRMNPVDALRYE